MFVFFHIFSLLWELAFPIFWELCGLTGKIAPNSWVEKMWVFPSIFYDVENNSLIFFKNPQPWNDMVFHRILPYYGNLHIHRHRWVFINCKSARQSRTWKMFVFSHTILVTWEFNHPWFGNCMNFCFTQNI